MTAHTPAAYAKDMPVMPAIVHISHTGIGRDLRPSCRLAPCHPSHLSYLYSSALTSPCRFLLVSRHLPAPGPPRCSTPSRTRRAAGHVCPAPATERESMVYDILSTLAPIDPGRDLHKTPSPPPESMWLTATFSPPRHRLLPRHDSDPQL